MSTFEAAAPTIAALERPSRRHLVIPVLALLAFLISVGTIGLGAVRVPFPHSIEALFGHGTADQIDIIRTYELPRVLLSWLVGGGLAVSGAVIQGVIRNPLAAPDIIGVTKGAGLAAIAAILIWPSTNTLELPAASFVGGFLAILIVYLAAYRGGASPVRLALVGVAVSAVCEALIRLLLIKNLQYIGAALTWLAGSLAGRGMQEVYEIAVWMGILIPLAFFCARRLDVIGLGDDMAAGLGERVEHLRRLLLLLGVAIAASAVAVGGTILFISLIAPHMARRLVGSRHALVIPASFLLGALLLLIADVIGRGAFAPTEIPAGLVTAVIGAPYFLYLLAKAV
jgi:ABC-type Fe3+-siderophore transport system permease subunit